MTKQRTEYGVQITEERKGRGFAASSYGGGQGGALPLAEAEPFPNRYPPTTARRANPTFGKAMQLGQHAVLPLPKARR